MLRIADLDAALADIQRAMLDSSTLIAFHSPHEAAHLAAEHLLQRIASSDDPLSGYYSYVSAIELLVRPIRTSQQRLMFMHTFLTQFPNLTGLPLDMVVAVEAATIRAATGLALPDALTIASGMLAGCEAIITNDARWKARGAPLFKQFRWIYLSDFI
ncbi:MAG: type II toxin-antitoxin system VapC family toxin [Dehalococcoidia bacterium]